MVLILMVMVAIPCACGYLKEMVLEEHVVDAVEVVRCKDCKWCEKHNDSVYDEPFHTCENEQVLSMICDDFVYIENLNHFCSYGERKEEES